MSAAVIGVIGVIAGAMVGGLMSYQLERSRRHALARVARNLIAAELGVVVARFGSSVETQKWWSGELPSAVWKANAGDLAVEVKQSLVDELGSAYALVELWNRDRLESEDDALSEKQLKELREQKTKVDALAKRLKTTVRRSKTARLRNPLTMVAKAGLLLAAGALVFAALAPRADLSDETIATALQDELGPNVLADCSHQADRWKCNVSYSTPPRQSCRAGAVGPVGGSIPAVAIYASDESAVACRPPPAAGGEPTSFEVSSGSDGPVATPSPSQAERQRHSDAIELEEPKSSIVSRAVEWIFASDE